MVSFWLRPVGPAPDEEAEAWLCPRDGCAWRTEGMTLADRDEYDRHLHAHATTDRH